MSPLLCHLSYPAEFIKIVMPNDQILLGMRANGKKFASLLGPYTLACEVTLVTEQNPTSDIQPPFPLTSIHPQSA
jgi:hypothetical protein